MVPSILEIGGENSFLSPLISKIGGVFFFFLFIIFAQIVLVSLKKLKTGLFKKKKIR